MDVSVASVTSLASTNQMRGVTNTLLGTNLEREPLQHNGGKTTEGRYMYNMYCSKIKAYSHVPVHLPSLILKTRHLSGCAFCVRIYTICSCV